MTTETDELKTLVGLPGLPPLTVAGREVALTPLTLRTLPAAAEALEALFGGLVDGGVHLGAADILAALAQRSDAAIRFAAVCTGLDADWLADRTIDEYLQIFGRITEVNTGFFILTMARMAGKVPMPPSAGSTPSNSSSTTATGDGISPIIPTGNFEAISMPLDEPLAANPENLSSFEPSPSAATETA
jgi:hypothetical protein